MSAHVAAMKRVQKIVQGLKDLFFEKKVLEVACGRADFSLAVSNQAGLVVGIDVSLDRAKRRDLSDTPGTVCFHEMDATRLGFKNESFDIVAIYNALTHLFKVLHECIPEMIRVLKKNGHLIFIATWRMDRTLIPNIDDFVTLTHRVLKIPEKNDTYHVSMWKET